MLTEEINATIAAEMNIKTKQVDATVNLLDGGNTVPFIARYRKEATGSLDEEQIRNLEERLGYLRNLVKRQEEILTRIEELGKLTPELKTAIEKAGKLQELEDLYLPYKQKKRTRAIIAREKGLEPLADMMLAQNITDGTPLDIAAGFVDEEKEVATAEDALAGAMDIVAEVTMEEATLRQAMRERLFNTATIATELDKDKQTEEESAKEAQVFLMYDNYEEPVRTLPSHRILAINRG